MVSLGKTSTPEFGSPCYTEPEGVPARGDAVGPDPDGRRLIGRRRGRRRGRAGAGRPGIRRRRLDPDPGLVLRPGGPQADPRSDQRLPDVRRPGRAGDLRLDRADRADAAALLDVLAGRRQGDPSWAPEPAVTFLDACGREPGRLRIGAFIEPVIADVDGGPGGACAGFERPRGCWRTRSRGRGHPGAAAAATPCRCSRPAGRCSPRCPSVAAAEQRGLLRPLTRWLGERGRGVSGPEFGLAIGTMRRYAADGAHRAGAVRRRADAHRRHAAAAGRRDPRRCRPGAPTSRPRSAFTPWTSVWNVTGMPSISLPLHWTRRRAAGRDDARGPAGRGGAAARRSPLRSRRRHRGTTVGRRAGDSRRVARGLEDADAA